MKRIWIDFGQPISPLFRKIRYSILTLGVLALGYVLIMQQRTTSESTALKWRQQNLARLESRKLPEFRPTPDAATSPEATKRANEVLKQLNQPWDQLFATLENAMLPGISMLSIAPDPHKASVTIKALAPNPDTAIDFVERLQASKVLTGAHLVSQEIMLDEKNQPIEFIISASWRALP